MELSNGSLVQKMSLTICSSNQNFESLSKFNFSKIKYLKSIKNIISKCAIR
jgi:hypothetical protein